MEEDIGRGLSAEAAVEKEQSNARARMAQVTDAYLRDRLHDLDDLSNRLLRILTGQGSETGAELPPGVFDLDLGTYMRPGPGGVWVVGGSEPECDPFEWLDTTADRIAIAANNAAPTSARGIGGTGPGCFASA